MEQDGRARKGLLRFMGDDGMANLHRMAGWLSHGLHKDARPGFKTEIVSGLGGFDAAFAVAKGDVDLGLSTPTAYLRLAAEGLGPFAGSPMPQLRGIGVVPQYDRLMFAVRRSAGVNSFPEMLDRGAPLRIAVSPDDGQACFGFAAHRALEAHGVTRAVVESWGGHYVEEFGPHYCIAAVREGRADALLTEAIMTSRWRDMIREEDMIVLPFEPNALKRLWDDFRMPAAVLPAGYYPSVTADTPVLEFSDFVLFCTEAFDDDLAYRLAKLLVETRAEFERLYHHIPVEQSPVTYPFEPEKMAQTAIPLHPGAARYYAEAGLLPASGGGSGKP